MAEQAKQQAQKNGPQPAPEPSPKTVTLDQILAGLSQVPVLVEDNDQITLTTKSFALMFVGILEIDDAAILRSLLRRRRVSAKFEDALELQE